MKLKILPFLFLTCVAHGFESNYLPTLVTTNLDASYIPDGFDTNDKTQIVAEGFFPNTCYRPAEVTAHVDHENKVVRLTPTAYQYDGVCLMVIVNYHRVVDLGLMKAGTYKIVQGTSDRQLGVLSIGTAQNAEPDDFLYAPISQAYFANVADKNEIKISGQFTDSCMTLSRVVVKVQPKVIAVQPISEVVERSNCVKGSFPFEKTVQIAKPPTGRYLLHVRSLNGQAINSLVDVY